MRRYVLPVVTLLIIASTICRADTLHLRNGMKIRGRVLSETDGVVVVKVQHGVIRFPASQVLSIDRDDEATNLVSEALELSRAGRSDEAMSPLPKKVIDSRTGSPVSFS